MPNFSCSPNLAVETKMNLLIGAMLIEEDQKGSSLGQRDGRKEDSPISTLNIRKFS